MMDKRIFNHASKFTQVIYGLIFSEEIGVEAKKFIKNLSYVGIGTILASVFSVIFNIYSGKMLGPSEYGKFTLIQSISMFLYIPMLLGYHISMVKYNTESEDFSRQKSIISNTYIIVIILTLVSVISEYFFSHELANIFHMDEEALFLSVILAGFFVLYTLTTETLRSLHYMKIYSFFQPIFSIIMLISFIFLASNGTKSSTTMIYSMYLAYAVSSILIIYLIRNYLEFRIDKSWIHCLTTYSKYAFIGGFSFAIFSNIDKILISSYIGITDVGIYRAYNYSFTSVIMLFSGMVSSVLFPFASMSRNKKMLFNKINRIIPYILTLGLPLIVLLGMVILKLYGSEYSFDIKLAFMFGICGVIIFINGLYVQLMNSIGVKGIKIVSFTGIFMTVINVILNCYFIPLYGVLGAIMATIAAYLLSISIVYAKMSSYFDLSDN